MKDMMKDLGSGESNTEIWDDGTSQQLKDFNKKEENSEWIKILKPNIRHLANFYHSQDPMKIL